MEDLADTKRRIVDRLKRVESATATAMAEEFELTDTAIRQHLDALEADGLVRRMHVTDSGDRRPAHTGSEPTETPARRRGRPPVSWQLTAAASTHFADRHGDLTVDLIESIRSSLGDEALTAVVAARSDRQLDHYREVLPSGSLAHRVRSLAALRTVEGYLAEVAHEGAALVLTEHHCPIQRAASSCAGLCTAELQLFQQALGPTASVVRQQHLLAGDTRCSYRITAVGGTIV